MRLIPITLARANDFVAAHHRHARRTARNGGRFAIGLELLAGEIVGAAIVGNPLSATFMDGRTAEVLRVCVLADAPKNSCSKLYAACWSAWRSMGGTRLLTYTLTSESGASLRGAGWRRAASVRPTRPGWGKGDDGITRTWCEVQGLPKIRWEVVAQQQTETQNQ